MTGSLRLPARTRERRPDHLNSRRLFPSPRAHAGKALAVAVLVRRLAGPAEWAAIGCACIAVAVFGILSWRQCGDYRDFETLWRETARQNPNAAIAQSALGVIALRQGHIEEAAQRLELALSLTPDDPIVQYNMGSLRLKQSRLDGRPPASRTPSR